MRFLSNLVILLWLNDFLNKLEYSTKYKCSNVMDIWMSFRLFYMTFALVIQMGHGSVAVRKAPARATHRWWHPTLMGTLLAVVDRVMAKGKNCNANLGSPTK